MTTSGIMVSPKRPKARAAGGGWVGWALGLALGLGLGISLGCDADFERMLDQDRASPYQASPFFADGAAMRTPPPGTVPWTRILASRVMVSSDEIPVPVSAELLAEGRRRFNTLCAVCHGVAGDGHTIVARNMILRPPPALIQPPIREYTAGRLFNIITTGFGLMRSYAAELPIADRWAVVAYVQALQLSQGVRLDALPADLQQQAQGWLSK